MDQVRLHAEPRGKRPVIVFAFTGWNDAGDAASMALRTMAAQWQARPIGEIDPELFTDFGTVRPSVYLDGGHRRIRWPATQLWEASAHGTDVILALGPEPALRWRHYCSQFVELAEQLDASMAISLGALLADYPHRHPVQLIGTASDPAVIDRFDLRRSTYEGPTGIVGVLGDALTSAGRPTVSLWATVPGYASQLPSPKACDALLRASCSLLGTSLPPHLFDAAIADYERQVSALVEQNEDLASYVSRLEALMDDNDFDDDEEDDDDADDDDADDNDSDTDDAASLVEEVERYLKESGES